MSSKKRKIKKKLQPKRRPVRTISSQQSLRLQQADRAYASGNMAFAENEYRALIAEKIRTPELYCKLAAVYAQTARRDTADRLWKQALSIDPRCLDARMNLADSYQQAGNIERAIGLYQKVIADNKKLVVARYLLANLLKSKGDFQEASDHYLLAIAQQPNYTQAHFSYSQIHKYNDVSDPHITQMMALYQGQSLAGENRTQLAFALAKAYENIGDYARSFDFLRSGNELRKKEFHYSIDSDRALIDSIINCFSKEAMSRLQVSQQSSKRPIFIVGMPRSGTSLVEKIIASHSDVYGAGELDYIFGLGTSLFLKTSQNFQFAKLDSYPDSAFEMFGRTYLERINQLNSESPRVTDKMPFNMMMLGLIKMVFPNARIIHCVRDARDTCLSIYKQNFTTGNYRFAYDLKNIGQFHNEYQKLMGHWHQAMPGAIYDVDYEALTHQPETEIRQLVAACDLEWQDGCLNFDKTEAIVKTASAYQARQPMYTSSVRLWEKYGENLSPLLEALNEV